MDLNICSRRVHDGYATIRARPRNRPRAVYRSDSEELLKETDGPYALPTVSNVILKNDSNINQVPRWSDQGKNILHENYGTLRRKNNKNLKIDKPLILNSFASQKNFKKNDDYDDDNDIDKHLYDTVASDDYSDDTKSITSTSLNDKLSIRSSLDLNSSIEDTKISNEDIKIKQPIYAIPNIKCVDNDNDDDDINNNINDNKNLDINYVPSGDLYRTTTKFIENINKNIAEIDKSYEELCYNVKNNSVYGVINKLKTSSSSSSSSPDNDNNNLYNYPRKRNMEPMPPITIDIDDKLLIDNDDKYNTINSKKNLYNHKNLFKKRTNSFGRHPPKLLPRLSSIDSNSTLRHSTGSTTTTSSTKSNESLCAISESLNELTISNNNYNNDVKSEESSLVTLRIKDQSISFKNSEIIDPGTESDDEFINEKKINKTNCKSKIDNCLSSSSSSFDYSNNHQINIINSNNSSNNYCVKFKKRCDTLPSRKLKSITRTICKSTDDVLDNVVVDNNKTNKLLLVDATDIIMLKDENNKINNLNKKYNNRYSSLSRTRHGSLDSDDDITAVSTSNVSSGFATLPRRRETITTVNNDGQINRRLSGNIVPVLEPLYEHAVSNPVKPRGNTNVIPWWELATKKYRHRSCPSLQAHVVSAFEQSLQNMTQRLQQLTATAEKKDSELQELRDTIERLRKQSAEASLNNSTSPNGRRHTLGESDNNTTNAGTNYNNHQDTTIARQLSADSVTSLNSLSSACSISSHNKKKGWLRSSFSKAFSRSRKNRHGSVSDADDCKDISIIGCGELSVPNSPRLPTSVKHENSHNNHHDKINNGEKSPDYIDNELTDNNSTTGLFKKDEDVDELKKQLREKDLMMTDIRLEALSSAHQLVSLKDHINKMRNEMLNLKQDNERLQRLVTSKSLTSSQSSLPSDPDRRFSMTEVSSSNVVAGLTNGDTHTTTIDQLDDLQITQSNSSQIINNNINNTTTTTTTTSTTNEPNVEQETDGKRINIAIYIGSENNFNFNLISSNNDGVIGEPPNSIISNVCISNKTTWDSLDSTVKRHFKDYINRVDPITNLGLGIDCLSAYHIGEASRYTNDTQYPELLPCGYLVGHVKTIYIVLSGYSWLAIDTLIPRSIVQRLVSQLSEHRRLILCGPSGAGKSYLAGKLANAFVDFDNNDCKDISSVATFNVDHNTSKELRQYLVHIAERCASNAGDELPRVIILENLQHATSLGELFSGLPGTNCLPGTRNTLSSCPAIIGTMSQATCNTTNLQLHHNFRWVLFANNMEPVKGFLGRYLRRKLLEHELKDTNNFIGGNGIKNSEMAAVVEWLPRVWLHLNKFLEGHSSTDVTIGPRLFLSCPMEISGSQVWFTDLWNYSVIPYLVETVREGLALYGRRQTTNGNNNNNNNNNDCTWEDPTQFIVTTYPWISSHAVHGGSDALLRLRPDDVGYDDVGSGHNSGVGASSVKSLGSTHSDTEGDPLLNMLMRLQEAANYSNPHGNDSDSVTSLDSSHTRHSEELNTSTSSSRGVESAL